VVLIIAAAIFVNFVGRKRSAGCGAESQAVDLSMGAGEIPVDLTGDYERDLAANIEGGRGEATVRLPGEAGVRVDAEGGLGEMNTESLQREGEAYVNDAYGGSDVEIRGGVGQIYLEVV
jgi:hypothetical protein